MFPDIFPLRRGIGFSRRRFQESEADYDARWSLTYKTLRALCHEHSGHQERAAVAAKVWIIGRTYATQIERKVVSDGGQGSALEQVTALLHRNAQELDAWIDELPAANDETLSDETIQQCIHAHGLLVRLLKGITHGGQSPRSFASKYLHFHRPAVPIYDSVASRALSKVLRWRSVFDCGHLCDPEDVTYREFVMHFRQLAGLASRAGVQASVRSLDWYLLSEGERLRIEVGGDV